MSAEFMAADDIQEMTDQAEIAAQERWLRSRGLPYRVEGRGTRRVRLIVSRHHVRSWLEGTLNGQSSGPNWASVK